MKIIHFLLDTKEKRESIVVSVFLLLLFSEAVRNMFLLFPMLNITALENLYELIPYAEHSFIGRMVWAFASLPIANLTISLLFNKLIGVFSLGTICSIVFMLYFLFTQYTSKVVNVAKRISWINLVLSLFTYGGTTIFIWQAIRFTTYEIVLNQVRLVSMWLFVMHGLSVLVLLVGLYCVIRNLIDALEYIAVEEN